MPPPMMTLSAFSSRDSTTVILVDTCQTGHVEPSKTGERDHVLDSDLGVGVADDVVWMCRAHALSGAGGALGCLVDYTPWSHRRWRRMASWGS
jgi:hypothetical protein